MTRSKSKGQGSSEHSGIDQIVSDTLDRLSRLWNAPSLPATVTVRVSPQLRSSLGRAVPATGHISIHPVLCRAPSAVLREVLSHETAHVVAYRQALSFGATRPRAHGVEWAALVRAAGYEPLVRAPRRWVAQLLRHSSATSRRKAVVHICPVCQVQRVARRAVPGWRCKACIAVGLNGRMEVVRLPTGNV